MQNPFTIPGRSESDGRPLCPWSHNQHEHLYAPVDHAESAFLEFQRVLTADGDLATAGRMLLVTGQEGCGKSALVHRAAWWAKAHIAAQAAAQPGAPAGTAPAHIVDLTTEYQPGEASAVRVQRVMRLMLDEARQLNVLAQAELDGLDKREDDLTRALPYLSKALSRHGVTLLVLLPPAEVPDDIRQYAASARPHLFFFAESSYLSEPEPGLSVNGKPLVHLTVGLLEEADGWAFVDDRLRRAQTAGIVTPTIDAATIGQFMRDRIKGRGKTTIRELQRTCESVFAAAIEAQRQAVAYQDFTQYYIEKATL